MSFNNDVMNYYIYAVNGLLCKVAVVHTQKPSAGVSGCVYFFVDKTIFSN